MFKMINHVYFTKSINSFIYHFKEQPGLLFFKEGLCLFLIFDNLVSKAYCIE